MTRIQQIKIILGFKYKRKFCRYFNLNCPNSHKFAYLRSIQINSELNLTKQKKNISLVKLINKKTGRFRYFS